MKRLAIASICSIAAILLVALLAGCGGGDDTTSGADTGSADTSESSSEESTSEESGGNGEQEATAAEAAVKPSTKPDRLKVRFAGSDYGELMERTVVAQ